MTHAGSVIACRAELALSARMGGVVGAAGLAAVFVGLALSPTARWIEPVGAAAHLALLPLAAMLPAPTSGRAMGFVWMGLDTVLSVALINGAAPTLLFPLRLGGHLLAAVWIWSAAWQQSDARRLLGYGAAATLGLHSLIAPQIGSPGLLALAGPLLVLWLAAAAAMKDNARSL